MNDQNRFQRTASDAKEYAMLQVDRLKLRMVESLATLFNNIFWVFVIVLLSGFVLMFLAVALTIALSELVGSLLVAVLIMAGVFLTATVIVYARRKKLIVNAMVRHLGKSFFEPDNDPDYEE